MILLSRFTPSQSRREKTTMDESEQRLLQIGINCGNGRSGAVIIHKPHKLVTEKYWALKPHIKHIRSQIHNPGLPTPFLMGCSQDQGCGSNYSTPKSNPGVCFRRRNLDY